MAFNFRTAAYLALQEKQRLALQQHNRNHQAYRCNDNILNMDNLNLQFANQSTLKNTKSNLQQYANYKRSYDICYSKISQYNRTSQKQQKCEKISKTRNKYYNLILNTIKNNITSNKTKLLFFKTKNLLYEAIDNLLYKPDKLSFRSPRTDAEIIKYTNELSCYIYFLIQLSSKPAICKAQINHATIIEKFKQKYLNSMSLAAEFISTIMYNYADDITAKNIKYFRDTHTNVASVLKEICDSICVTKT